jgi:hypothetical protein
MAMIDNQNQSLEIKGNQNFLRQTADELKNDVQLRTKWFRYALGRV